MIISEQRYAFFDYSRELHKICAKHDDIPNYTDDARKDSMIRVSLDTLGFLVCRKVFRGVPRGTLPNWAFHALYMMPDAKARKLFITQLYQEMEDSKTSNVRE